MKVQICERENVDDEILQRMNIFSFIFWAVFLHCFYFIYAINIRNFILLAI